MGLIFRPLSAAAVSLRKQAMNLLNQIPGRGVINRIYEIFIIRASRSGADGVATVIEVPAYIAGGYGGRDGTTDYFTPFVIADLGPALGAVTRRDLRRDDLGNPIPNVPLDKYKTRAFLGGGRVVIGDVPAWSEYRQALNDTAGVYTSSASAITTAVCPALDEETPENHPWVRSLTVCRLSGASGAGDITGTADSSTFTEYPADVLPGHVMMNSADAIGSPGKISGVEIAQSELGIGLGSEIQYAGAAIEWGPLRGMAAVQYYDLPAEGVVSGSGLKFARYEITDNGVEATPRYTGAVSSVCTVDTAAIPVGDKPTALSAVAAADTSFTYPAWASNTTIAGRDARDGLLSMRDPNVYSRLFSASMGNPVEAAQTTITLVEIQCEVEAADVSVRGYKEGDPVTFNTVSVPAQAGIRTITYVAEITPAGAAILTKLEDFLDSRYETAGPLIRRQIQTFGGCTTAPSTLAPYGSPRLFCSEWGVRYEVRAAEPDGADPLLIQGEPERRVQQEGNQFVRLSDLEFYLLSASGAKTTLALGDYFPALFSISTSAPGTTPETLDGRSGFANSALRVGSQRVGNDFPVVHCQFAPGVIAVLIAPRSGYTSSVQVLRIALFSVASGAMLVLSPALLGVQLPARMSLSCYEQGTVDEAGNVLTYGRLLLGVSTLNDTPSRTDGWFSVTGLRDLTWVSREPSNTPPVYVGNPMVPAEIGVTTKLTFTKPTLG